MTIESNMYDIDDDDDKRLKKTALFAASNPRERKRDLHRGGKQTESNNLFSYGG